MENTEIEALRKEQIKNMYELYVSHASANDKKFNRVMKVTHVEPVGKSYTMYRFEEFEHIWVEVMMTLQVILASR